MILFGLFNSVGLIFNLNFRIIKWENLNTFYV